GELSVLVVGEPLRDELVQFPLELVQLVAEAPSADALRIAQIAKLESSLEEVFQVTGKADGAAAVRLSEETRPPDEVPVTELVRGGLEAVVRRPAVPTKEARVLSTQNRFDDIEAATRLD